MLRLTIRFMKLVAYCVHILLEYCFRLSIGGNILTSRENSKEFANHHNLYASESVLPIKSIKLGVLGNFIR